MHNTYINSIKWTEWLIESAFNSITILIGTCQHEVELDICRTSAVLLSTLAISALFRNWFSCVADIAKFDFTQDTPVCSTVGCVNGEITIVALWVSLQIAYDNVSCEAEIVMLLQLMISGQSVELPGFVHWHTQHERKHWPSPFLHLNWYAIGWHILVEPVYASHISVVCYYNLWLLYT